MTQPIDDFQPRVHEMCQSFAVDMEECILSLAEKMTPKEWKSINDARGSYLMVRAIAMVVGQDALKNRFDAEAIRVMVPRLRRIYRQNRD